MAKLFSRIDADGSGQAYQLVGLAVGWDGLACVLNKNIHKSKGGSGMLVCGCSGVCVRARARNISKDAADYAFMPFAKEFHPFISELRWAWLFQSNEATGVV